MIENPILVVQVGSLGDMSARVIFDLHNVKQNREYIFFDNAGEPFLGQVVPGRPQLVFLSHNDEINAFDCAEKIKEKNPKAIVFAIVPAETDMEHGSKLDAFIPIDMAGDGDIADLVQGFIEGIGRVELIELIEGFGGEN